jgi:pyrroloquinoline-quinone synthase
MNLGILDRLHRRIDAKRLLDHPFYQDWKDGKLTREDLSLYAAQYHHFEASFPRFLSAVHSRCPDPEVRQYILDNLWDEEHGESNHRALWLRFATSLGRAQDEVLDAAAHPKTRELLDTYKAICSSGSWLEGLATIYAYEAQVPEVMAEKLTGLRDRYGMVDEEPLHFFRLHSTLDVEHSRVERESIARHTAPAGEPRVEAALQAGLDAWWGFLDGVQELRGAAVASPR